MRLTMTVLALLFTVAAAPAPKHYYGFSCVVLAQRRSLPGTPGVTFRVLKIHFAANQRGHEMHRHKLGEILYLLSGSGWNAMNGKKTPLSSDAALVIPAATHHEILPGPAGVTLLTVQFTDTKSVSPFEPKKKSVPDVCAS